MEDRSKVLYLDTPVKSENDRKEYRIIQLENGLKALLISDFNFAKRRKDENVLHTSTTNFTRANENVETEEKMAACCLSVNVGSFADPPEIQGMAHLLEHVVTMGSKEYPENEYSKFITERGGNTHADTSPERTNFLFQIHPHYFLPALDRFAHIFIDPLLDKNAVLRERESIDNEYLLDVSSDYERMKQLFRIVAKKDNPASKFSCGNLVTLRDNVNEDTLYNEILAFRNMHYSANRMSLAIQATLSLDILEEYVNRCFSKVSVNNLPQNNFTKCAGIDSFDSTKFRKIYKMKAVQNMCELEIKWIMPPSMHLYKIKPMNYISWIVNREGKGTLSRYLRERKLCDRLSVSQEQLEIYSVFKLNLVLSHDASTRIKEILDTLFSYMYLLRAKGPQKEVYDEMKKIADIKFRFVDEISAAVGVQNLASGMHLYPSTDYLTRNDLYFNYDAGVIQLFLDCLTPENAFIVLMNSEIMESELTEIEPWYRVRYTCDEIPDEWYICWKQLSVLEDCGLPEPNRFIATDFTLVDLPLNIPEIPIVIDCNETMEIWYCPDGKYRTPKCFVYLQLTKDRLSPSVDTCVMMRLLETLVHEMLIENLYDAKCAGLAYNVLCGEEGIVVHVNGFSQKVPMLLNIIMRCLATFMKSLREDMFHSVKRQLLKYYSSILYDPGAFANEVTSSILEPNFWLSTEKHTALNKITFKHFVNFAMQLINDVYIRCLVQGNVTEKQAIKIIRDSAKFLQRSKKPRAKVWSTKNIVLPLGKKCCYERNQNFIDVNSVVMHYCQTDFAFSKMALPVFKEFLEMIIQEPLFNELRIKEQLGYSISYIWGLTGFAITVYSPVMKHSIEYLDERIEAFMKHFCSELKEISEDEFNLKKDFFIKRKTCSDINLKDEVNRNWFAISTECFVFDDRHRLISDINDLKIENFHRWIVDRVMDERKFRKLSVRIEGNTNFYDIDNNNNNNNNNANTK